MAGGVNPKPESGRRKVPMSLVPAAGIVYEAMAFRDGAQKYGSFNWRSAKVSATVYLDAALRHLAAWFDGEDDADDSGLPHLAHAKACLGIIIDALESGNLDDDRPTNGPAAAALKRFAR